jgi:hypothetical protein
VIDYPGNGGTDLGLDEKFRTGQTGTYTVNSNCTGFMTIDLGAGVGVTENGRYRGISVEFAFTYSSHTWLHVLSRNTGKETIWGMPTEGG